MIRRFSILPSYGTNAVPTSKLDSEGMWVLYQDHILEVNKAVNEAHLIYVGNRCPECGTIIMENGRGAYHSASCKLMYKKFKHQDDRMVPEETDYEFLDRISDEDCTCNDTGTCASCIAVGAINEVGSILREYKKDVEKLLYKESNNVD